MKPPPLTIVTTGNEVAGHEIVQYLGIVRGIVVRSAGIGRGFIGGIRSIGGGNIPEYAAVCEEARLLAYQSMLAHAAECGADAIIAFRGSRNIRCRPFADSCRDVALPLIINRLCGFKQHPGACHRPRLADS
jgi:uncharacterized protein YbjQ (UPF0145 family)